MVDLTVAAIVKDEAGRFLPAALAAWTEFADRVVVLDDGSSDGTPDLLEDAGCIWKTRQIGLWGNETTARRALWEYAVANTRDWLLILDADMVPADDPKPVLAGDSGAFRLFDIWGPGEYRDDAWWNAHNDLQMWAFRAGTRKYMPWTWEERGIHAYRCPSNAMKVFPDVCEVGVALLHYAYATPELRAAKTAQYRAVWDDLGRSERFHASTIEDPAPRTKPLPFKPRWPLT